MFVKKLTNTPLIIVLISLVAITSLNISYYLHAKTLLIQSQKDQMMLVYENISAALDVNTDGEKLFEDMIGTNLRTAAIAARNSLNPNIDKVDNEELSKLSKQLGVDEITLFKKTKDDIIGLKSSDPKEINSSSKNWGMYYTAFNQLFDLKTVDVGAGQVLPHYWSGPIDTSSTNQANVDKWGYYFDGTTNYIIDPFVHDSKFKKYQNATGADVLIKKLTAHNNEHIIEISLLSSDKLLESKPTAEQMKRSNWFSERLVIFGEYKYRDADEKTFAEQAIKTDKTVFYVTKSNGKSVIKSFTPIHSSYLKYRQDQQPTLVEIASDYSLVQAQLNHLLNQTILFMLIATAFAIAISVLIFVIIRRNKEKTTKSVQDVYVGNLDSLFQSIKEQRHDFNNHMATIQSLLTLKKFDELYEYTTALIGENKVINDLININVPALSAIVQVKMAQAEINHIAFEHDFKNMADLRLTSVKTTDIVRILSNLIDNALDAAMEIEPSLRKINISGKVLSNQLHFKVFNTGKPIPIELQTKIFEPGFSTKSTPKNSGQGLYIVKQLISAYKGSVNLTSNEDGTEIFIVIPITKVMNSTAS